MDLFNTLGSSLYPSGMIDRADSDESKPRCPWNQPEHDNDMSNHYNDERDERIAESVYEIVDSLSAEAIKRLLEEHLIESALDDEDFAWEVQYQTRSFIHQAELKAELSNA